MPQELTYQIALSLVNGIGPVKAKKLLAYCGSAEAIFKEKPTRLIRIPDIGAYAIRCLAQANTLERADEETHYMAKNNIVPVFYTDKNYPDRLRLCDDAPILLYTKGNIPFQSDRIVAIVGTRNATDYGKNFCEKLIYGLKTIQPLIVSGLAYGIDVFAHKCALNEGVSTVACLAHGLHTIYPSAHGAVADDMIKNGGLISEYLSGIKPDRELFPMRNRIIAGMADCTVVIETDKKGGSIITAQIANSYGREVFALPGRYNDFQSRGCNELIKKNIAAILTSPEELVEYMNWGDAPLPKKTHQQELFVSDDPEENLVLNAFQNKGKISLDLLIRETEKPIGTISAILLKLEFKGLVKSLPGKLFQRI